MRFQKREFDSPLFFSPHCEICCQTLLDHIERCRKLMIEEQAIAICIASISSLALIILFYGWSKLGDEGLDPKQPYIHRASEQQLLLMAPTNKDGGDIE